MLFHRKMLSKRDMRFVRSSRVMLCRNLAQHQDSNFRSICLEMHFLSEVDGKLGEVPDMVPLRALPRYPSRRTDEAFNVKKSRLENLVEWLSDRSRKSNTVQQTPPRLDELHL